MDDVRAVWTDISRGLETLAIPLVGDGDVQQLPPDFTYVRDYVVPADLPVLQDGSGCDERCSQDADQCCSRCPCSGLHEEAAYECGPACACTLAACRNRVSQHGVAVRCEVHMTRKGWSVYAMEPIEPGAFVCLYAGELLSSREAERRLLAYDRATERPGHALLVVREILPSGQAALRMNIDATKQGNIAAFINHSCDGGNLRLEIVRRRGTLLPAVALLARRQVQAGEELSFSYGQPSSGRPGARRCLCGTPQCLGFLPSEL